MSRLISVLLVLTFVLVGCASPSPSPSPVPSLPSPVPTETALPSSTPTADTSVRIVDALGREVILPAPPQRIVITGRALFMIADAAYIFPEASKRIVGLGDAGQGSANFIRLIDPEYAAKQVLERDAGAEQVAALQPDLVLLKSYLAETVGAPIEALGIPVVYIDLETREQYLRDLAILGKVFGDEARAAQIADFYQNKVIEIAEAVKKAPRPRVLLLYYNDRDGNVSFNVPPLNWIQTEMVQLAGGQPIWADANPVKGWTQVTLEQIAVWDADYIFIISYFKPATTVVEGLKTDPNWQGLRAVREGNLYAFPADLYSWDQPDTRWILGLTWLAATLHPEYYSVNMKVEVETFYQTLYSLDRTFVEQNIVPTFKGVLPEK